MKRRKWIIATAILIPSLVLVCLAAVIAARPRLASYDFLRGGRLVESREMAYTVSGKPAVASSRTFVVKGRFDDVTAKVERELGSTWSNMTAGGEYRSTFFYRSGRPVGLAQPDTISVHEADPIVGWRAPWTGDSVAVSIDEGPKPIGWFQGVMERLFPPKPRSRVIVLPTRYTTPTYFVPAKKP
jgi:hypothetical protein